MGFDIAAGGVITWYATSLPGNTRSGGETWLEKSPGEEEKGTDAAPSCFVDSGGSIVPLPCPTPGEDVSGYSKRTKQAREPSTKYNSLHKERRKKYRNNY